MSQDFHLDAPDPDSPDDAFCEYCERPIIRGKGRPGHPRRYGSNRCRQAAWRMRTYQALASLAGISTGGFQEVTTDV